MAFRRTGKPHSPPPFEPRPPITTSEPSLTFSTPHPLMIFFTRIRETDQIFAHVENKSADMVSAMTFKQGVSGNPHGNRHRTRHLLNQEFMQALLLNFRHEGKRAIEKVARNQPAAYVKILALLVPREMQVEHTNRIKQMTDEELEAAVELLQGMIDAKLAGANATLIEEIAEPVALPAPDVVPHRPNKVMDAADTAVGARKRKPGVPSPGGT
jgi:hypothetical protein